MRGLAPAPAVADKVHAVPYDVVDTREARALAAERGLHRVGHGLGAAVAEGERLAEHRALHARLARERAIHVALVVALHGRAEPRGERIGAAPVAPEEHPALEHRRERHHAQREEEIQHPARAEQRHANQGVDEHRGFPFRTRRT